MKFTLRCQCGQIVEVTTGDAGSQVRCECSRSVNVPSLHQLRQSAGIASLSADVVIETLLRENRLPEEQDCVSCGSRTNDVRHASVDCESEVVQNEDSGFTFPLFWFFFGFVLSWMLLKRSEGSRVLGQNLSYRLPIRICHACGKGLTNRELEKQIRKIPVYADLLAKYPNARVRVAESE